MQRPTHLPDFEAPPLAEVAISLQFQPIDRYGIVDIGLLWDRVRDRFPRVEYHPPVAANFETFGLRQGIVQELRIDLGVGALVPRTWFVNDAATEIIQIQPDRLVHNWRKAELDNVYPRFEQIRARFAAEVDELSRFLADRQLGPLVPNQCEIAYVNIIAAPDGAGDPTSRVFKGWSSTGGRHLGEAEDIAFTARFVMTDDLGEPIGRVIAQSVPGLDAEGRSVIQFTLVGRGPPASPTLESALEFIDVARDRIVCGFAELTSEQMHTIWRRTR